MVMFHTYVSLPEGIFSNMLALTNAHHVTRCHFPSSQIASLIYVYIVIIFIDRRFFALPPPQDMTRMSTWACIAYHMIADDRHVNLSWFSTSYHWNPQFQETIRKYKHIQRQTYTDIHRHTQTYTHAYTHTYRHVRTYIALGYITLQKYIHTHTCMCIYIYIYIHKRSFGTFLVFLKHDIMVSARIGQIQNVPRSPGCVHVAQHRMSDPNDRAWTITVDFHIPTSLV